MPKSPDFLQQLEKWGPNAIIEKLAPYLTDERKERVLPIINHRMQSIQIAVENPSDIHNAFAIVRTSEALGLTDVHLIGEPQKGKGRQTMRGSDRWIDLHMHQALAPFCEKMRNGGLAIYGASPQGKMLMEEVPLDSPCCFLFGNEKKGLSDAALSICSLSFTIPMYGFCESYNLSIAAAITLYHAAAKKRQLLSSDGDLSDAEKLVETAWFYYKSAGSRLASAQLGSFNN